MWEPGFWNLTDREADVVPRLPAEGRLRGVRGLRRRAAVGATSRRRCGACCRTAGSSSSTSSHRIFDSFFEIQDIDAIVHPMSRIRPSYYGIFEDNDPSKRLMVVANFDNDVPEYWEWSGQGLFPVRRVERGLQAGRQLHDLRPDALSRRPTRASGSGPRRATCRPLGFRGFLPAAGPDLPALTRSPLPLPCRPSDGRCAEHAPGADMCPRTVRGEIRDAGG